MGEAVRGSVAQHEREGGREGEAMIRNVLLKDNGL